EDDLYEVLSEGYIFGAAIDAFAVEPVKKDHKLLSCPNFVATPHNGANTVDALKRMGTQAIDEIVRCKNESENLSPVRQYCIKLHRSEARRGGKESTRRRARDGPE